MLGLRVDLNLYENVRDFVRSGFAPSFGQLGDRWKSSPLWTRLRELDSELWLDTGSANEADGLWSREFKALTTNNTLLNREVQLGQYDDLIARSEQILHNFHLSDRQKMLEIAFILNAWHALRLVEQFDAFVSVEEHTLLAYDVDAAVEYGRRYYGVCPERFIVKVPFTPAGVLAARRLAGEGIPVNQTLGFSARQNYLSARIAMPAFVNVFLGRLNSFVADNGLGDGRMVGEKATLASQAAVREVRSRFSCPTRQIAASFRSGQQVLDLAGVDVMTMPPKVAQQALDLDVEPRDLFDCTGQDYHPALREGVSPGDVALDTLWEVDDAFVKAVDALESGRIGSFSPHDLVNFFADHGCCGMFVHWSEHEIAHSYKEGKIPRVDHWGQALRDGRIGLDALMNLAGLNAFAADQKAMDDRVRDVLRRV